MALILKDRVQETSTTTGTGTLTLAGAVTQFQAFSSAIGNGNTTYYAIYNAGGSDWEVGIGTVGAGTLSRDTVLSSSNAGSLVSFTGTLYVFCDYPASKAVFQDANGEITGTTINANTKFVSENYYAQSILGGNLRTSGGTSLVNWDGGGSGNVTINGGLSANPTNKNISLAPTGTGSVTINPATAGSINNVVIGATTPLAITGTTITATTFSGSGASLTSIPNSALVNSAITINGTSTSLGGSVSVGTVTSIAASVPSFLSISGSPITSSGTLAIGLSGTALPAANGGTGLTSPGTSGNVLTSNGTGWVSSAPSGGGNAYVRTSFTATSGQTTFSATYNVGYVAVYLNGVLLNASDYTASNGTSVVLAVGAVTGDIVELLAYQTTTITNTTASNIVGGSAGQLLYQSAPNVTAFQDPFYGTIGIDLTTLNGGTSTTPLNPLYFNCGGAT